MGYAVWEFAIIPDNAGADYHRLLQDTVYIFPTKFGLKLFLCRGYLEKNNL